MPLHNLESQHFDLAIIGGGIHGAFAAWDATLRGMSVALIDKGSFGAATSANCMRIVHGGIRYLQNGDFTRAYRYAQERDTLCNIAPDHVRPLRCMIPLSGNAIRKQAAVTASICYNLLSSSRVVPRAHTVSRDTYVDYAGIFAVRDAKGGMVWHDALIDDPENLTNTIIDAARNRGAVTAQFTEAVGLVTSEGRIKGIRARTGQHGTEIIIRSKMVLNAAGPWAPRIMSGISLPYTGQFMRACNLVIARKNGDTAVAVPSPRDGRFFFSVPWNNHIIIGTSMTQPESGSDDRKIILSAFNEAAPELNLCEDDITGEHSGLIPSNGSEAVTRTIMIDHSTRDGIEGLITMIGVKWTGARYAAEKVVNLCQHRMGIPVTSCLTATTPVHEPLHGFRNVVNAAPTYVHPVPQLQV